MGVMTALDKLKSMYNQYSRYKWPNVPDHARAYPNHFKKSTTTNGLTACIISYIELMGWQAERTGNEGRVIDNRKSYTDAVGFERTIGSVDRVKGTGKKGTSDIKATILGRFVAIEIKNIKTRDKISPSQQKYKQQVERAGGIYHVITDLESGVEWLDKFETNPFREW